MKFIRSKTNLAYGLLLSAAVVLYEISVYARLISGRTSLFWRLLLFLLPIFIALYFLLQGLQMVWITRRGVVITLLGLPFSEITWDKIREAGVGRVQLSRRRYSVQLYVADRPLSPQQRTSLSRIRPRQSVLCFDDSAEARLLLERQFKELYQKSL